jgi:hypothetical protein
MTVALALCGLIRQSQALVGGFSHCWPADSQLNNAGLPLARRSSSNSAEPDLTATTKANAQIQGALLHEASTVISGLV